MLFTAGEIGTLELPNRLVRSATAEQMTDPDGRPQPRLADLYRELVRGGVGLIITGHMYVHPSGKAHPRMTAITSDELIPALAELTEAVHDEGGRVVAQINHGGMYCSRRTVSQTVAPSRVEASFLSRAPRALAVDEIEELVQAYGEAARRARQAGFDGVQIHGAHGYLVSQFLSPFTNRRSDAWGGDLVRRTRFLREVCRSVRERVGRDYPVLIKLGMKDALEDGLTADEGAKIVAALGRMELDGVEISGGIGGGGDFNTATAILEREQEAYFRPLARQARPATSLPILLVGGLRSRWVMEDVLRTGDADFVSLCRPLICEPDLPNRLRLELQERSRCISANRCWPEKEGQGIACRCPIEGGDSGEKS